ncbi:hypothetical protein [uncultured Clostridium sp.]|uniref:hypothetical protein n=1 Tax=uncultured Clostridium sp. TaxID=59620 RepID=UPI00261647BD|nr:hypothetical protein [uncultured Clostridium sp.]
MSNVKTIVITNMILMVIGIIVFVIGYRDRNKFRDILAKKRNADEFEEIINLGYGNFVKQVLFFKFIPLMIFAEVIFSYFYGLDKTTITVQIVKLAIGIGAGLIYAAFQWKFYNNLVARNMEAFKKFSFMYIYIIVNGVIAWGIMIGVAVSYIQNTEFLYGLAQFLSWIIAGLFFGLVDWNKSRVRFAHYLGKRVKR